MSKIKRALIHKHNLPCFVRHKLAAVGNCTSGTIKPTGGCASST